MAVCHNHGVNPQDIETDLGEAVREHLMADPVSQTGVDERKPTVILKHVTIDMAEPRHVDGQHDSKDAGSDLFGVIVW